MAKRICTSFFLINKKLSIDTGFDIRLLDFGFEKRTFDSPILPSEGKVKFDLFGRELLFRLGIGFKI